jgi:hypothetical protein
MKPVGYTVVACSIFDLQRHPKNRHLLLHVNYLTILSSETSQGLKLGSSDRYWFNVVVLGIMFNFYRDAILDSFKTFAAAKAQKLKFGTNIRWCCKSLQRQLKL